MLARGGGELSYLPPLRGALFLCALLKKRATCWIVLAPVVWAETSGPTQQGLKAPRLIARPFMHSLNNHCERHLCWREPCLL